MAVSASQPIGRDNSLWETQEYKPLFFNPEEMNLMERRLSTFWCWPADAPDMKYDMAKEGLYYTGFTDTVKCFHCGRQFNGWRKKHSPTARHQAASRDCPMAFGQECTNVEFVPDLRNTPVPTNSPIKSTSGESANVCLLETDGVTDLGVSTRKKTDSKPPKDKRGSNCRSTMWKTLHQLGFEQTYINEAKKQLLAKGIVLSCDTMIDKIYKLQSLDKENEGGHTRPPRRRLDSTTSEDEPEKVDEPPVAAPLCQLETDGPSEPRAPPVRRSRHESFRESRDLLKQRKLPNSLQNFVQKMCYDEKVVSLALQRLPCAMVDSDSLIEEIFKIQKEEDDALAGCQQRDVNLESTSDFADDERSSGSN